MEKRKPFILIIYGPTAVGKTDFVEQLSQQLPIEIINMDMGQFYTKLSIGTAKPDWRSSKVPHHLFDIIKEPKNFTVVEYRKQLTIVLHKIWARGRLPVMVGGSGFYLKSVFFPPHAQVQKNNEKKYILDNNLWNQLKQIDPKRASQIDPHDTYRIKRALDIWFTTRQKPSEYIPEYNPLALSMLLFLTRERDDLYNRINQRVINMINTGWINEVELLRGSTWEHFIKEKKIIGYDELFNYLKNPTASNLDHVITIIQKKTRNYAKRQITFWRMLKHELTQAALKHKDKPCVTIESVNLTFVNLHLYIKQLLETLNPLLL